MWVSFVLPSISQRTCHLANNYVKNGREAGSGLRSLYDVARMPSERSVLQVIRNSLQYGPLSFRDFMELALYHPELGYYARPGNPVGKGGDYVTAPSLSPVFAFAIARLFREFVGRCDGEVCSFVDIGCGDGGLVRAVSALIEDGDARFFGVDRALDRAFSREPPLTLALSPEGRGDLEPVPSPRNGGARVRVRGGSRDEVSFVRTLDEVPRDGAHFIFSSELYDAIPFSRLVRRGEHLHEL